MTNWDLDFNMQAMFQILVANMTSASQIEE